MSGILDPRIPTFWNSGRGLSSVSFVIKARPGDQHVFSCSGNLHTRIETWISPGPVSTEPVAPTEQLTNQQRLVDLNWVTLCSGPQGMGFHEAHVFWLEKFKLWRCFRSTSDISKNRPKKYFSRTNFKKFAKTYLKGNNLLFRKYNHSMDLISN